MPEYYARAEEKLKNGCTGCGNCVSGCRAAEYMPSAPEPRRTQKDILEFLRGGEGPSEAAGLKAASCMRCYGCLDVQCPIGINSLQINELIAREMHRRGKLEWDIPLYPVHEGLARQGTTEEEYRRITTPVADGKAACLFFPGCNVYKQPDKLLNALTILDATGEAYSFAPGMLYCCGSSPRGVRGDVEWARQAAEKLFAFAEDLKIKKMIFWCPTCMSVLQDRIRPFRHIPFACVSLSGHMLEHMGRLRFPHALPRRITYHEPCKNAYMGIEPESARRVLLSIPGTELLEMKRHGKNTACCGGAAAGSNPEVAGRAALRRLREARATGADTLVTLCHNCHLLLKSALKKQREPDWHFSVENFSTYVAGAMGLARPDSLT